MSRNRSHSLLELATRKIVVIAFCAFWTLPAFIVASNEVAAPAAIGVGISADDEIARFMAYEPEPVEEGPPLYTVYKLQKGESISKIAQRFQLNIDTIISVNGIVSTRYVPLGKLLKIPNQNGILHTFEKGESAESVARSLEVDPRGIYEANALAAGTPISAGSTLFIPGAKMDSFRLREINGDLFRWPLTIRGFLSSYFGWRADPHNPNARQNHTGIDIAAPKGTRIVAAMEGRVVSTGYSAVNGNYIIISHHSGYKSFYGHLSAIKCSPGQEVSLGQYIGDVGNTGLSTGSHLHFSVYKYGRLMNPLYVLP